ncbi:SRPBCC family protein [Leptospira sp. FAT2]|uniref:SRPBCC family protein n=1 Tax=Leptospira sanjuanensis TaxID=2879643 RepID=UPI001EE893AC|nr:SRPBCC family protein [Leptospira sanjuanensis]MCG6166950.1 SRPBCC family protein [Leptospira sanjuanensis]MCG6192406.1 SRPBCC family protein [Leptospira sanjuanensis]
MENTKKLKVVAQGEREILITRTFDAPRALVFDAMTKPELLKRWFDGPPGWSLIVCDIDLKVGGKYRYVWRSEGGKDMGMGGVYLEIDAPDRLVATEVFDESWYAGEAIDTSILTEIDSKTTLLSITVLYESKEARESVILSPMEDGLGYNYDRLEALLETFA